MVLAEHELLDTAESLVEEANRDRANGINEQEIRKRLSVRLRNTFPEADVHIITEVAETAIRKAGTRRQRSKLQTTARMLATVTLSPVIKGMENMPASGAAIIAPRHYHGLYDQGIVMKLSRRKLNFFGSSILFAKFPYLSGLLEKGGVIPVKSGKLKDMEDEKLKRKVEEFEKTLSNTSSFKTAMEILNQGGPMVIFPEGVPQVGGDNKPVSSPYSMPMKGFVFLAYLFYKNYGKSVPIVPVGLNYGDKSYRKCKARVGKPVYIPFQNFAGRDKRFADEMLDYYTNAIFSQIKFLSENWEGEPPEIPYPEEAGAGTTAEMQQKPAGIIHQAEKVLEELTHKSSLEEHGIPIIKAVLERKINLVNAGMQAKAVYSEGRLSFENYQTILHVLHAIGRYLFERDHHEMLVSALENIANHTAGDNRNFVEEVIALVKGWDEEKRRRMKEYGENEETHEVKPQAPAYQAKESGEKPYEPSQTDVLSIIKKSAGVYAQQERKRQTNILDIIKRVARKS